MPGDAFSYPITQGFGPTSTVQDSGYKGYAHFNKGLDFGAPSGTKVPAMVAGTVVSAGPGSDGWGTSVKIKDAQGNIHNYGHLGSVSVKAGDQVSAGQQVGLSGNTGVSTGPHLSYDVLGSGGEYIDPSPFIGGGSGATDETLGLRDPTSIEGEEASLGRKSPIPSLADIRNAASNPDELKSRLLGPYYDFQDRLEALRVGGSLVEDKGLWGKWETKVVGGAPITQEYWDGLPASRQQALRAQGLGPGSLSGGEEQKVFVPDAAANGLAKQINQYKGWLTQIGELEKSSYYKGGGNAAEQYITSMDLESVNRQRENNQWNDFVIRLSTSGSLIQNEVQANQRGEDQNAQNWSAMRAGNAPWGSFGSYAPIMADSSSGARARDLLMQQGWGEGGQELEPIPETTVEDFQPWASWEVPDDFTHTPAPRYAMGTGGLAGLQQQAPAWPWPAPKGTPPDVIGVPQGLWSLQMGRAS